MKQRFHDLTGDELDMYLRQQRAPTADAPAALCDTDTAEAAKLASKLVLSVQMSVAAAASLGIVKDQPGVQKAVFRMALEQLFAIDIAMDDINRAETDR